MHCFTPHFALRVPCFILARFQGNPTSFSSEMDDDEEQENELMALASIYDEHQFMRRTSDQGRALGHVQINTEVPKDFVIRVPRGRGHQGQVDETPNVEEDCEELALSHLPPIVLRFLLPPDYPSQSPPTFNLSCQWLDVQQLSLLCKELDQRWLEQGPGDVILFQWIQFLTDETLASLGIDKALRLKFEDFSVADVKRRTPRSVDPRVLKPKTSLNGLVLGLIEHARVLSKQAFDRAFYDCQVCFEQKQGFKCIRFPICDHVFCNDCMSGYFRVQIEDGAVRALNCPSDQCDSQANPRQVKELVSSELYEKYEKFLLQSGLDCMSDILYCPRLSCQLPVIIEADTTCAICPNCKFAFCIFCKRSFHGIAPCPVSQSELRELREEYLKASPVERVALEKKYGKERLKHAVEDMISEQWLDSNAKKCPECGTHIQKIDGCNKMTCTKCRCYFCWLCCKVLDKGNPYLHFNAPGAGCFNRLFEGIDVNEDIELDHLGDDWMLLID